MTAESRGWARGKVSACRQVGLTLSSLKARVLKSKAGTRLPAALCCKYSLSVITVGPNTLHTLGLPVMTSLETICKTRLQNNQRCWLLALLVHTDKHNAVMHRCGEMKVCLQVPSSSSPGNCYCYNCLLTITKLESYCLCAISHDICRISHATKPCKHGHHPTVSHCENSRRHAAARDSDADLK